MTIVMGLDQHRAQISAEWIDTATGEISRKRVAPADREGVRRFAARFRGEKLEVALEATTGWRFVVEEFEAVGAHVHLAEPAETAARRGTKKRAKSDRADARHLRELLMVGRLPESWIPPEHLLELRARVRLRHTLVDQRREWQQRMQAVLYHHGVPPRSWLLGAESRAWLAGLELPPAAREQITVGLALVDAHDAQLGPLDQQLRAMRPPVRLARPRLLHPGRRAARRQPCLPGRRAQAAQAQLPHPQRTRRGGPATRMTVGRRAQPSLTPMHRGQLPACSCRHHWVDGLHRPSGRTASRNTPSTIMSPLRSHTGTRTEIRLGVRAHRHIPQRAHAPPPLTAATSTDKEPLGTRTQTEGHQAPRPHACRCARRRHR
ncbi:MAG: transposase [Actinobacteria bacterium]|nr:transposase [Actinomycetota bacterium]